MNGRRFLGTMSVQSMSCFNDWEIRPLLVLVLALLLALWGLIATESLGLSVPFLRQIIGFLLLTFIPGILLLRIFRIHNLGVVRTVVYSAGLSLATLMFTGFFANVVFPLFGIFYPISLWPLMTTISTLVGILGLVAWIRDRDFKASISINFHEVFSPPVLVFFLLPFGAIASTYLMNFYDTNVLQMIVLLVVALVPVVITYTQLVPEKYYPYIIFCLAITLLYHTVLISTHVWGWDIQYEYYLTNKVVQNSVWDTVVTYSNCDTMLSLVMLAPAYSILLGMGLEWVFKIVYPLIFALVPFGLYAVYQKQTPKKIAFLACFFFVSIYIFYIEMLSLARQEIAELFLVLVLLSMIDRDLSGSQKSALLLIFTASVIVSHYGISYIFMLMLLLALVVASLGYYFGPQNWIKRFFNIAQERVSFFTETPVQRLSFKSFTKPLHFIIWYSVILLAWSLYTADSSSFKSVIRIARPILSNLSSDLLNPGAAQGLGKIVAEGATSLHEIWKYLHLLTILFIILGFVITILIRQKGVVFNIQYLLLTCGALGLCIGGVGLPYFASALNTSRLYQICLILLAPFCIIGGIALASGLRNLSNPQIRSLRIIATFLGVFLLFNCGWVYEACVDEPTSFALNSTVDYPVFSEQEIFGALWLVDVKDNRPIIADVHRSLLLTSFVGRSASNDVQTKISGDADCYMYIGRLNIINNHIAVSGDNGVMASIQFIEISNLYEGENAIYTNGCSEIYSSW